MAVVSAFAQTLRRYTSLNHLAQAARAVLQNTSQINQMLSDLNRVDFANVQVNLSESFMLHKTCLCLLSLCFPPLAVHYVFLLNVFWCVRCVLQEQASWVCQCDESVVQRLEQDFKVTLQQQSSLDQWATWLDNVVSQVLKPHQGSPSFPKAARQFLLKWSFYRYEGRIVRLCTDKITPSVWFIFLIKHLCWFSCLTSVFFLPVAPWWSETWPCVVQPVLALSTWFACCMMSTCSTWSNIVWLRLLEKLPSLSWERYERRYSNLLQLLKSC